MKNVKSQLEISAPGPKVVRSTYGFKRKGEVNDGSTKTIPDDSFTIAELFNRYRVGAPLPLGIERAIQWGDEPTHNDLDMSRIRHMDLVDVQRIRTRLQETVANLTARQKELTEARNVTTTNDDAKTAEGTN